MTRTVQDIILKPMQELYLPPLHLRHDADAQTCVLDAYAKALAPFDADTLQRAWQKVIAEQTNWIWPSCGSIAAVCRQCQPKPAPPSEEERRREKALQMADDYAAQFMKTSHLANLATREGWSGRLREYVYDAAWVQAQLLCHVRDVSFSTNLIESPSRFHSSREAFAAYCQTIGHSTERGEIHIGVPPARIQEWQERRRQARQTVLAAGG
jgi:hypothetical protein